MSDTAPNELPKLKVRSREVSEEDQKEARKFEEQSAFEHTVSEASEEQPKIKRLEPKAAKAEKNETGVFDPEATLVVPHQAQAPDTEQTTFIPHDQKNEFMNVTALEPEEKLPSDLPTEEPAPKKTPLKLARPTLHQQAATAPIPSALQDESELPNLATPEKIQQQKKNHEFQEKVHFLLDISEGKIPKHILLTCLALAAVLLIVSSLMGTISLIPALLLGFSFSVAASKLANQQFFLQGLGALTGRAICTGLFLIFTLFTVSFFSNTREGTAKFVETQSEAFLDRLENFDEISNENAKSFYILLKGNESETNSKLLKFNQRLFEESKNLDKSFSSFGIQLFLMTIAFFLIGLARCKYCFVGAPLALSPKLNTLGIVTLSRTSKACLAYLLTLVGLSFTGIQEAGYIAAALFVITLISPFSMLALFTTVFTLFLCQDLSDNQIIVFTILFIVFLLMELNFKLFVKPFAFLDKFIPSEFFATEIQDMREALLGTLQLATQVIILILCAAIGFFGYSVYDIKKTIDANEAIYVDAEKDFKENGPNEDLKTTIEKGLYQREGDRRWFMLKLKYFMAKGQYTTALDIAEAYKEGEDYPALNPDHYLVKFLKKNFNNEFDDIEENASDKALALLLSSRKFSSQQAYIDFAEQHLADNPESLITYLATARYYIQHRKPERIRVNLKAIYQQMSELNPTAPETVLLSAWNYYFHKDYEKATTTFEKILSLDSTIYKKEAKFWLKKTEETSRKAFFGDE